MLSLWIWRYSTRLTSMWAHAGAEGTVHATAKSAFWIFCVFVLYWSMPVNCNNWKHTAGDAVGGCCQLYVHWTVVVPFPARACIFFLPSQKNPDRLWRSLSFLFTGHRGHFPGSKGRRPWRHNHPLPRLRPSGAVPKLLRILVHSWHAWEFRFYLCGKGGGAFISALCYKLTRVGGNLVPKLQAH